MRGSLSRGCPCPIACSFAATLQAEGYSLRVVVNEMPPVFGSFLKSMDNAALLRPYADCTEVRLLVFSV